MGEPGIDSKRASQETSLSGSPLSYAAGPAVTLAVLLASMALCGIYPFGDHAFLARDGAIQYVGFYGWYHNVLTGGASACYSLSKGLGGATFGLFAYYLSSPLALLAAFFDAADSAKLFSLLAPIKLVAASFTCGFFLMQRFGRRSVALSLIGCAYALSAYSFTDGLNVMWLDGMALAPLVAWGAWRLVRGESPVALFCACAASIVCNWYIGYMTCLFAVVWLVVELVARPRSGQGSVHVLMRFAATMALAVGAGCIILLPVAIEQISASGVGSDSGYFATIAEGVSVLNPLALLQAMVDSDASFAGATNAVAVPWVLLLLVCAFFVLPSVPVRAKAVLGGVFVLFVASFVFKPLDMVWTGFVRADSYNPRYFFLFLLVLCFCAGWALEGVRDCLAKVRRRSAAWLACVAVLGVALAVGCGQLATHGLSATDLNGYASNSVSRYHDYMAALAEAHDEAEGGSDLGIVRMENAASSSVQAMRTGEAVSAVDKLSNMMTTGEYMALGDSSLSHYSSAADGATKELLGNLGYCLLPGSRGITTYHSPVFLTDSLLGVGWVVDDEEPAGCVAASGDAAIELPGGLSASLYRDDSALGWGYAVPAAAESVEWTSDPFTNQERFASMLSGEDCAGMYAAAQVAEAAGEADGEGASGRADAASSLAADAGASGSSQATCSWTVTAASTGPLYLWIASAPAGAEVSYNGKLLQTTRSYESDTNIMYLGQHAAGESVIVSLAADAAAFDVQPVSLEARTLDLARAKELLASMGEGSFTPDTLADGHIAGTFSSDGSEKLLLTIPATDGWTAFVDGSPAAIENVNGLIALNPGAGEHAIELRYETPGLKAGIAVCVCSVVAFAAWRFAARRRFAEKLCRA